MKRAIRNIAVFLAIAVGCLGVAHAQALDISSGGAPTITGSQGGSVTGSSSVLNNLSVTINFGELSPINRNPVVKVTVPVAVRSNQPYRVTATVTGSFNANPQALQRSDIGFGIANWRAMGSNSRNCRNSPHIFYSPFSNDPSANASIAANGRVTYPSTLNNIAGSTVILSGPRLSNGNNNRQTNDGYIFDAIFAVTPQFFFPGTTSATLTLTISAGPNVPC